MLRAAGSTTALVVIYYLLPLDRSPAGVAVTILLTGLVVFIGLITFQVRSILGAPFPALRATEALATSLPLFLVLFASTYLVMATALTLNQVTGSSACQGAAAVLIALVMIRVSLRLISRSHDFLTGAWAGAAGGRKAVMWPGSPSRCGPLMSKEYEPSSSGTPGVTAIGQLLVTFLGPGRLWIIARVDIDDALPGSQVKALERGIESGMKHEAEEVYRIDVVDIGAAQAAHA
jgi:divalent metal cation (Fe/Co/Zn/Cd) transporter